MMSRRSLDDYLREVSSSPFELEGGYSCSSEMGKENRGFLSIDGKRANVPPMMRDYLISVVNGWRPPLPPKGRYTYCNGERDWVERLERAWDADPDQRPTDLILDFMPVTQTDHIE